MSVHAEGTISVPAAVRSHQEPQSPLTLAAIPSGQSHAEAIGDYWNTGNVDQTLDLTVTNTSNCTVTLAVTANDGSAITLPATISPQEKITVIAEVTTASEVIGSGDQPYSFDINSTWS